MTIAYPFGRGGGSSAQDKRIRRIGSKYYFGGRSAGIGPAGFTGYNDFTNPFYDAFYLQLGTYVMGPGNLPTAAQLSVILDSTVKKGGIFTGLYHGIETGGFNNLPATTFNEHLDSMVARQNNLWVAPFNKIIKYHKQRRAEAKLLYQNHSFPANFRTDITFKLEDTLSEPWYNEPLTVRIPVFFVLGGVSSLIDSLRGNIKNFIYEAGTNENDTLQFDLQPGDTIRFFTRNAIVSVKPKQNSDPDLELFPNPSGDQFTIRMNDQNIRDEKIWMQITNLQGKTVEVQKDLEFIGNELKFKSEANLPKGVYLLDIQSGSQKWKKRWIKE
jgi:hypothetical protein